MRVTRLEIQSSFGDDACMVPARDGDYVALKDYLALRALVDVAYREAYSLGADEEEVTDEWMKSAVRTTLEGL